MCSGGWERRLPPQLTVFPFGDIYCGGIPCPGPPRNGTSPSTILSLRYTKKNITEYCLLRLTPPPMGWLIYAPNGRFTDPDTILEPLSRAYPIISGHMHCDIAFYCSPAVPLNQLNTLSGGCFRPKGTMSCRQAEYSVPVRPIHSLILPGMRITYRYADGKTFLQKGTGRLYVRKYIIFLMTPSKKSR